MQNQAKGGAPGKNPLFKMEEEDDDEPMFGAGLKNQSSGNKFQPAGKKMPNFLDDEEDDEEEFIPKIKATPAMSVASNMAGSSIA